MRFLATFLFVLSVSATAAFGSSSTHLPVPRLETLPNGLQIAWFLSDSIPVVDLALLIKSGYRDDPAGKSGTVALLDATLDRGNAGMTQQQIAEAVEKLGASRYASADDDYFTVGMHGLAPDAPALLDLMAKIAIHPEFPQAEIAREQARMLDRWNHIGDYGETLVSLAYRKALANGTSYERGSLDSVAEFKKVTRDDVVTYYRKHFTPANAILMVIGRVKPEEFLPRIVAAFGGWSGAAPAREWKSFTDKRFAEYAPPVKKGLKKREVLLVDRPSLTQAQVRIGFRAPLIRAPEHYALLVGNALLGEYFNSRLNSLIRDKLGLTYGISSTFSYSRDFGGFTISSATKNESVGELIQKTLEVLRTIKREPVPADEVRMAKEYLIGGFPLGTATLAAVASRWSTGYVFDLGPDYLNEFVPKVSAITAVEVTRALVQDFDLDHVVIAVAGDGKEIEKSLKAAVVGPIKRVSTNDLM
jgi:zinc protease